MLEPPKARQSKFDVSPILQYLHWRNCWGLSIQPVGPRSRRIPFAAQDITSQGFSGFWGYFCKCGIPFKVSGSGLEEAATQGARPFGFVSCCARRSLWIFSGDLATENQRPCGSLNPNVSIPRNPETFNSTLSQTGRAGRKSRPWASELSPSLVSLKIMPYCSCDASYNHSIVHSTAKLSSQFWGLFGFC